MGNLLAGNKTGMYCYDITINSLVLFKHAISTQEDQCNAMYMYCNKLHDVDCEGHTIGTLNTAYSSCNVTQPTYIINGFIFSCKTGKDKKIRYR